MPHTVTLTYQPVPRLHASRVPGWRRLLAIADAAVQRLTTLWQGLFLDLRGALRQPPLETALDVHLLEGRSHIAQVVERTLEVPARTVLPVLAQEVVTQVEQVMAPEISRLAQRPVTPFQDLPRTQAWLQHEIGSQIRDISQTTLRTVQQVLREGVQAGHHPRQLARSVREVIGLTPQQQRSLEVLKGRLQGMGLPETQIQRQVQRATETALSRRALTVARTEALSLSNRAAYENLLQSTEAGFVDASRIRRHWLLTSGACALCIELANTYSEGVGLYQPFGDVMTPPLHPNCRCSTTTTIAP